MIAGVPRVPLWLGLMGLLPMVIGVAETYLPFARIVYEIHGNGWFIAPYATLRYAEIILCFMSGVFWGFAARSDGATAGTGYVLSVIPALYVFFMAIGDISAVAVKLAIGFMLVLWIDWLFYRQNLTPDWWMRLRIPLTVVMVACLLAMAYAHHD